jgi:hypothetical protein
MTRHFVIARAAPSVRFGPQENLKPVNVPAGDQRAEMSVQTRYSPEGFTQLGPRELWIEATGTFASLDYPILQLMSAVAMVLPALAFARMRPIDDLQAELAFGLVDDGTKHEFFQRYVQAETGFPRARRRIPKVKFFV